MTDAYITELPASDYPLIPVGSILRLKEDWNIPGCQGTDTVVVVGHEPMHPMDPARDAPAHHCLTRHGTIFCLALHVGFFDVVGEGAGSDTEG